MSVVRFDGADNNSRWHGLGGWGADEQTDTLEEAAEDGIKCELNIKDLHSPMKLQRGILTILISRFCYCA
jgi:hypothetical protein